MKCFHFVLYLCEKIPGSQITCFRGWGGGCFGGFPCFVFCGVSLLKDRHRYSLLTLWSFASWKGRELGMKISSVNWFKFSVGSHYLVYFEIFTKPSAQHSQNSRETNSACVIQRKRHRLSKNIWQNYTRVLWIFSQWPILTKMK